MAEGSSGGLRAGKWQPGQALALVGPVQSAKSLCQSIITVLMGGRSAKPYPYMTGATTFNADLHAAEHLSIEDVAESIDIRKRRSFGAQIKAFAVNREQQCHGKNQTALTLTPWWRVTISLNDDPERLLVLPPMDEDIADKIMLLKVAKKPMPKPTETADEKDAFWKALLAELPAFAHYLSEWEIPVDLRSARFGVRHYHHPDLLAALESQSPEEQLLEMIDKVIFHPAFAKKDPWAGQAADIHAKLTSDDSDCKNQALRLLQSAVSCGTYLGRLADKRSERVSTRRINGRAEYTISPPSRDEQA